MRQRIFPDGKMDALRGLENGKIYPTDCIIIALFQKKDICTL